MKISAPVLIKVFQNSSFFSVFLHSIPVMQMFGMLYNRLNIGHKLFYLTKLNYFSMG